MINYKRVAKAINYIKEHSSEQPNLDEIANAVHLSPYHFHRIFKEWAGVTPKNFLQYISLSNAKKMLMDRQSIEQATFQTGLSGTSRLHDLFVNIEGMTPGEFKNGGQGLKISYQFGESPFGDILIASTGKGICGLMFVDSGDKALKELKDTWHNADFIEREDEHIAEVQKIFTGNWKEPHKIKLHLSGSDFQIKVWEALLKIPVGKLATYSVIADSIGNPKASRAVGTALANNPVAYLIPCHRVIKKAGGIGEYRWGSTRKTAIIGWEAAKTNAKNNS
jgi:AraC family transcriptional regulator of adaptative response/methylated-DNA-[protein]-cysteine methyltransferase